MIVKSIVFINALKAAYQSLGMTAAYAQISRLTFTAVAGLFAILLNRDDEFTATDVKVLAFFKSLTDQPGAAEDATLAFFKSLADNGYVTDAQIISVSRPVADAAAASDDDVLAFSKVVNNSVGAADAILAILAKTLSDQVSATDDIDGSSSVEDDQEIQFFKTSADAASVADVLIRLVTYNKLFLHTTSATDTGSIRSQGYADFTYFAEDYVGSSRTFS